MGNEDKMTNKKRCDHRQSYYGRYKAQEPNEMKRFQKDSKKTTAGKTDNKLVEIIQKILAKGGKLKSYLD